MKFDATRLDVRNVPSDVHVHVHQERQIVVNLPTSLSNQSVLVEHSGETLSLFGTSTSHAKGIFTSQAGQDQPGVIAVLNEDSASSDKNQSIRLGGDENGQLPVVTINVPLKTPVALSGIAGQSIIDDTEGHVLLVISPLSGPAQVGRIRGGIIVVQESGLVDIDHVLDAVSLQLTVLGRGAITVAGGNVDWLSATIQGTGYIAFGGTASHALLVNKGSGTIDITRCTSHPLCFPCCGTIRIGDALFY